jgi:hypothetical protein
MALDLNQNISLNYCLRVALRWKNFCLVLLKVAAFQVLSNYITLGCKLTKNFTSRGDKSRPGLDLYADLEPGDVDLLEEGASVENQDPAFR